MKGEHQVRIPEWETNESLKKKYGYTFKHGKTTWTFVEEVEFRNFEHPDFGCLNEDELLLAEETLRDVFQTNYNRVWLRRIMDLSPSFN